MKGSFSAEMITPSKSLEHVWTAGFQEGRDLVRLWRHSESWGHFLLPNPPGAGHALV